MYWYHKQVLELWNHNISKQERKSFFISVYFRHWKLLSWNNFNRLVEKSARLTFFLAKLDFTHQHTYVSSRDCLTFPHVSCRTIHLFLHNKLHRLSLHSIQICEHFLVRSENRKSHKDPNLTNTVVVEAIRSVFLYFYHNFHRPVTRVYTLLS